MTTDLICLLVLALWSVLLNHIPAVGRVKTAGVAWAAGNRETTPEAAPWVGRADRAKQNHHDNLAAIAIVILLAQITGHNNQITAIASIAIVVLRILHGLAYIFGISIARSLSYFGSLLALLVIVWQLFV